MAFLDFLDQVAIQGGEEVKRQRQRRETMDDLVTLEQAKAALDPKTQAIEQARKLAQTIGIEPKPLGGYNTEEIARGIPQQVQQNAATKELEALQRFGVLPQPTAQTMPLVFVNPTTGEVTQGGTVPKGAKVINQPDPSSKTTAQERKATSIAQKGQANVSKLRELLGVQGRAVTNRAPLNVLGSMFKGSIPGMSTNEKELRDTLNATLDLVALLRTGTAGERGQLERLQGEYNLGSTDSAETLLNRLQMLETELGAFASGERPSPVDAGAVTTASGASATQRSGGQLMEDANGNRAMVYPDGTIEELP